MMDKRYKIILSNQNLYKEIELAPDMQRVVVGTDVDCDVRLRKELFFGNVELQFVKNEQEWTVVCSDNLYLTVGDVRKLATKKLSHGETLEIKYQESDNLVVNLDFLIDFDDGKTQYNRIVDVTQLPTITIGNHPQANITLSGEFVANDSLTLTRSQNDYIVDIHQSTYGVYINGKKASNHSVLKNGDFLSIADYFFFYKDNRLWTQSRSDMGISGLNYFDEPSRNTYPKFNRNTRLKTVVCEDPIEILAEIYP